MRLVAFAAAVITTCVLVSAPAHGQVTTLDATSIPTKWPGERFDVIWTFALDPAAGRYAFGQVPQQLLEGDADTVI